MQQDFDAYVTVAQFDAGGRAVFALGDGSVRFEDGQAVDAHEGAVLCAAVHPSGEGLLTGGDDGRLVWSLPSGPQEIAKVPGRWIDAVLSRIGDIFFAIPYILAAIVIMSVVAREARSILVLSLAIGIFAWPSTARVLRGQILSVKNSDFVMSAAALGVSHFRILLRHVLPNSIAPVIVITTIGLAGAIVAEATLSFLGIGLPRDVMSWGKDISDAQGDLRNNPMTLIYPSIALSVTVLSFILLGEVLRDALDPKARARR